MIPGSIKSFVLPRSDGGLGDDQQLVDLAVAQLVVVGVAVAVPEMSTPATETKL